MKVSIIAPFARMTVEMSELQAAQLMTEVLIVATPVPVEETADEPAEDEAAIEEDHKDPVEPKAAEVAEDVPLRSRSQ